MRRLRRAAAERGGGAGARRGHQPRQLRRVHRGRPQPCLLRLRQAVPLPDRKDPTFPSLPLPDFPVGFWCLVPRRFSPVRVAGFLVRFRSRMGSMLLTDSAAVRRRWTCTPSARATRNSRTRPRRRPNPSILRRRLSRPPRMPWTSMRRPRRARSRKVGLFFPLSQPHER